MKKEIIEATLRLFKAVYTEDNSYKVSDDILSAALTKGILFNTDKIGSSESEQLKIVSAACDLYGKNLVKLNKTFHKTWKTVEEIDPTLHYLQQCLHYITTYGYDLLGISYDASHAYIPEEKVPMPENAVPYNFTIIRVISKEELIGRIECLLESGVALSTQQVSDVVLLMNTFNITVDFDSVKNKEAKTMMWLILDKKPYINVDEFLRALTYLVTGDTLVIRSYRNHQAIKMFLKYDSTKRKKIADLLSWYTTEFGIENIAGSYLRNRMLFLAFKCDETKKLINRINRKADKYNKPKDVVRLSEDDILEANVYQLVKYWNYCNSMLNPTKDKLYQIRNGKNYLTENSNYGITGRVKEEVDKLFGHFKDLIEFRLRELLSHLKDSVLIIPDYIDYKVPSSLKRLASGVPEGTAISFDTSKPFVIGIHWENQGDKGSGRVDLDLHANSRGSSYGWNSSFRSSNAGVLYSGDMTDAPISKGGASEALRFTGEIKEPLIITLNDYTHLKETKYKFIFDVDCEHDFTSHHTDGYGRNSRECYGSIFSKNARTLNCKVSIANGQNTLGIVLNGKFYFMNSSIFSGRVTQKNELLYRLIEYYEESQKQQLSLRQLADIIGCRVVSSKDDISFEQDENGEYPYTDILDLSLEGMTEDTFPILFTNNRGD